jgi:hypothetical protein
VITFTRKWKVILLVCVIVPLSFLVAWQTGLIGQPSTETINIKPVTWEFAHPTGSLRINQWQNASFVDNACSIAFAIVIGDYSTMDSLGTLRFLTRADISGKSPNFYVKTASVSFANLTGSFGLEVQQTQINFENLSLAEQIGAGADSVGFVGNSSVKSAYLSVIAYWTVNPPANLTCQATAVLEVVYFNGIMFRQILQPFNLILNGDRHVLEINALLISATAPGVPANVPVWVDDTQYTTPVLLLLPQGTYVLKAESQVLEDSQNYSFLSWQGSSSSPSSYANPFTLNLASDNDFTVYYG